MDYEFKAPVKDPQAILRHSMRWTDWLDVGETITAQTVVSSNPSELVVDQVAQSEGVVAWRVSGGQPGGRYTVTCQVQTSLGRLDERSVLYPIGQR